MSKKIGIFFVSLLVGLSAHAEVPQYSGIIVTANGSNVSYALKSVPTVTYSVEKGVKYANLTVNGQTKPTVKFPLSNGQEVSVVYGTYLQGATDVQAVTTYSQGTHKYVTGGKLVIITADGRMVDIQGRELK